ncbi:MAG: hypothetical protein EXR77_01140 [Myxococcales bacterium]|nr:hypothetical protein [Myxococcales bacterium]
MLTAGLLGAVAAVFGVASALASRIILIAGLYEVAAALLLGSVAVALCHLQALRPNRLSLLVAVTAAAGWLAVHETTDAWAFRQEQIRWLQSQPIQLAQDMAVAQVDSAELLVDLGLRAETGDSGLVGAWLAQNKAGIVVQRTLGVQRVLPLGWAALAAAIGVRVAIVALLVWRALLRLAVEPRCPRCQRYLRRTQIARVSEAELAPLITAWQSGEYLQPGQSRPAVAVVYRDECARGHLSRPGLAAVRLRRFGFALQVPGPVAQLAPVLADPSSSTVN